MPRDSSGNYTLPPAYNPVLTGTTITTAWANTTMNDIAAALTDSLSRSGKGGITSPFLIPDGTITAPGLAFAGEQSTGLYRNGASQPTFTVGGVSLWAGTASHQFVVTAPGGTILNAPSSGYTITVNGPLGVNVTGVASTQLTALTMSQAAQQAWSIYQLASSDDFRIYNSNSGDCITINKFGQVSIPAPKTGNNALATYGVAGSSTIDVIGPTSPAGSSFGIYVQAGTNTGDYCIDAANAAGTGLWYVQGDGQNFTLTPPAYTDRSATNLYQIGYLEILQDYQAGSWTLVMGDRGKNIFHDSTAAGHTYTIPVGIFPIGTTITITNVQGSPGLGITTAGDTLRWVPNNITTLPRTLAGAGLCTITKMRSSEWWITGVGIS